MKPPLIKVALWTSSVGVAVLLARHLFRRRVTSLGSVSDDWLAQHRGMPPADPFIS